MAFLQDACLLNAGLELFRANIEVFCFWDALLITFSHIYHVRFGGGGGKVRFRYNKLRHLIILLFIAGEPQKLDRQKYTFTGIVF